MIALHYHESTNFITPDNNYRDLYKLGNPEKAITIGKFLFTFLYMYTAIKVEGKLYKAVEISASWG
jgi:hypothetical protein